MDRSESEPYYAHTPQQQNGYDCGVYTILIAKFIADKITSKSYVVDIIELCSELRDWLTPEKCREFRKHIMDVVDKLH